VRRRAQAQNLRSKIDAPIVAVMGDVVERNVNRHDRKGAKQTRAAKPQPDISYHREERTAAELQPNLGISPAKDAQGAKENYP
jgi:hypothetical protein